MSQAINDIKCTMGMEKQGAISKFAKRRIDWVLIEPLVSIIPVLEIRSELAPGSDGNAAKCKKNEREELIGAVHDRVSHHGVA